MKISTRVLRIFLRIVESFIKKRCKDIPADSRIGAVSFVQYFGDSLNSHVHYHCIISDGVFSVFEEASTFHQAQGITDQDMNLLMAKVKASVLRYMTRQGLIDKSDSEEMLSWDHNAGFSIDASVAIPKWDRVGLERLVRYCSRPPFALGRLIQESDGTVVYVLSKPDIYSRTYITMTPIELLQKLSQLIPPPRVHRHIYYGVFAPNYKLRKLVIQSAGADEALKERLEEAKKKQDITTTKKKVLTVWALLIARIYEVLPLLCPRCQSPMRIIEFVTDRETIEKILTHVGEKAEIPKTIPARIFYDEECERGPPEYDDVPIIEYK